MLVYSSHVADSNAPALDEMNWILFYNAFSIKFNAFEM